MKNELELASKIRKYARVSPLKTIRDGAETVALTIEIQAARIAQLEETLRSFIYWADAYENEPEMQNHPMMKDLRAAKNVINLEK